MSCTHQFIWDIRKEIERNEKYALKFTRGLPNLAIRLPKLAFYFGKIAILNCEPAALLAVSRIKIAKIKKLNKTAIEKGSDITLAHWAAEKWVSAADIVDKHPRIAKLATSSGWTVLHEAVLSSETLAQRIVAENSEFAKIATKNGWTVAHAAVGEWESAARIAFEKPKILSLKDSNGVTVAHIVAKMLWDRNDIRFADFVTKYPNLAFMRDKDGVTVFQVMLSSLNKKDDDIAY